MFYSIAAITLNTLKPGGSSVADNLHDAEFFKDANRSYIGRLKRFSGKDPSLVMPWRTRCCSHSPG